MLNFLKNTQRKRLNDFSKVSGYKISIYNNQMYFYPWQWTMENEIKGNNSIYSNIKENKIFLASDLGENLMIWSFSQNFKQLSRLFLYPSHGLFYVFPRIHKDFMQIELWCAVFEMFVNYPSSSILYSLQSYTCTYRKASIGLPRF